MAPVTGPTDSEPTPTHATCWCCGSVVGDSRLARLGSHPEVGVCADCAHFLHRRAKAIQDATRPSPARLVRTATEHVRQVVMHHQWQHRPVIGPALRWLNRHTP